MVIKIEKKELEGLKELFRDQPQVVKVIESYSRIFEISESLEYPLKDFKDLLNKVGDTEIEWLNQKFKLSDLQAVIPDNYYPIADQDDFLQKAQQLIKSAMASTVSPHEIIPLEKLPEFPPQLMNYKPSRNFPGFSMIRIKDV